MDLTPPPIPAAETPSKDERLWATVCHLLGLVGHAFPFGNVVGPLVVFLLKREGMPFVADQGKEAVNFQISASIYFLIAAALWLVFIGIIILPILYIGWLILMVIAAIKANEGVAYRYPATIRFLQ